MENPYAAPQGEIVTPYTASAPLSWKQILFSFQGRIPRRQYWAATGIYMLVGIVCGILFALTSSHDNKGDISPVLLILAIPLVPVFIWSSWAVGVKRWHDRDKSGWWMLIGLIPYIGGIWQFIECGCLRGTEGPNRFGGDPT